MAGYEVIGAEEQSAINSIFESGGGVLFRHGFEGIRGNSYQVLDFEKEFRDYMGAEYSLAVSSGTAALRVALAGLKIGPGDEVITQSFTFVATVESIIESGATPICTEIDETLNMSPSDLLARITPSTKAVIVVHMLGGAARIDEISKICKERAIPLIEDTAWGCGGDFSNVKLGTIGDVGCYSFDFAKTITTGEGGMVVFKNRVTHDNARAYHDHGHDNNPNFPRWEDTRSASGFNYRMSELQAAVGREQLKKLDMILRRQRENAQKIKEVIQRYPGFKLRTNPFDSRGTEDAIIFHANGILKPNDIRKHLLSFNISTKILPEASTWHFARSWNHLFSTDSATGVPIEKAFPKSQEILSTCVSIPNMVFLRENFLNDLDCALKNAVG